MIFNLEAVVNVARFFFPKEKAWEDVADAGLKLYATPEFIAFENAVEAAVKTSGCAVIRTPSGRIATITPPYVAPARQSPTDFNLHSSQG